MSEMCQTLTSLFENERGRQLRRPPKSRQLQVTIGYLFPTATPKRYFWCLGSPIQANGLAVQDTFFFLEARQTALLAVLPGFTAFDHLPSDKTRGVSQGPQIQSALSGQGPLHLSAALICTFGNSMGDAETFEAGTRSNKPPNNATQFRLIIWLSIISYFFLLR